MSETSGLRTRVSPIIVGLAAIAVRCWGRRATCSSVPTGATCRRPKRQCPRPIPNGDLGPRPLPPRRPFNRFRPRAPPSRPRRPRRLPKRRNLPVAAGGEPPPLEVQSAAVKKRALLMGDHNQRVTLEADERAFDTLQLPDATRAAIRQINGSYVKTTRDAIEANAAAWSPGEQLGANLAKNDEADRARRAALKEVLGADGVSAFETAEYAAARRLRRQYSAQWAQELEQQAPLPEGLPPSPH